MADAPTFVQLIEKVDLPTQLWLTFWDLEKKCQLSVEISASHQTYTVGEVFALHRGEHRDDVTLRRADSHAIQRQKLLIPLPEALSGDRALSPDFVGSKPPKSVHISSAFDNEICKVVNSVEVLSSTAIDWMARSSSALSELNVVPAHDVLADPTAVDALRREIIEMISAILIKRHPFAIDFRLLMTARDMAIELADICAAAKRIAERVALLVEHKDSPPISDFGFDPLKSVARTQLELVVSAYSAVVKALISGDEPQTPTIAYEQESQIRQYNKSIMTRVEELTSNRALPVPTAVHLMLCSEDLKIIAVRSLRAAESVEFLIHGSTRLQKDILPDGQVGGVTRVVWQYQPERSLN